MSLSVSPSGGLWHQVAVLQADMGWGDKSSALSCRCPHLRRGGGSSSRGDSGGRLLLGGIRGASTLRAGVGVALRRRYGEIAAGPHLSIWGKNEEKRRRVGKLETDGGENIRLKGLLIGVIRGPEVKMPGFCGGMGRLRSRALAGDRGRQACIAGCNLQ